jgi:predicted histidine transporter YuiF (NhaC family)
MNRDYALLFVRRAIEIIMKRNVWMSLTILCSLCFVTLCVVSAAWSAALVQDVASNNLEDNMTEIVDLFTKNTSSECQLAVLSMLIAFKSSYAIVTFGESTVYRLITNVCSVYKKRSLWVLFCVTTMVKAEGHALLERIFCSWYYIERTFSIK